MLDFLPILTLFELPLPTRGFGRVMRTLWPCRMPAATRQQSKHLIVAEEDEEEEEEKSLQARARL